MSEERRKVIKSVSTIICTIAVVVSTVSIVYLTVKIGQIINSEDEQTKNNDDPGSSDSAP